MAIKQADLAKLGIETESGFLGTPSGSVFLMPGAVTLDWTTSFVARQTRIGVWRQEDQQSFGGLWIDGSMEIELNASRAVGSILDSFFTQVSVVADTGFDTYTWRPWRHDPPSTSSLRLKVEFDGHWIEFSGVVITRIRFTGRVRSLIRATIEWIAARVTEYTSDPSWTFLEDASKRMTSEVSSVEVDAAAHNQLMEFSLAFTDTKQLTNMNRAGEFTQATRDGQMEITGTLVEYFDATLDLAGKSRAGTAAALTIAMPSQGDATRYLNVSLPEVVFQSADPVALAAEDSVNSSTFYARQPSALDDLNELSLEYTFPT